MSDARQPAAAGTLRQMAWLADDRHDHEDHGAGDVIFAEGDAADRMYVVRAGEVEIRVGDKVVGTIDHGGIFGEMALIDHTPRSATAVAKTDCDLLPIDERMFLFLVDETPYFALDVMRILAARLRAADRWL